MSLNRIGVVTIITTAIRNTVCIEIIRDNVCRAKNVRNCVSAHSVEENTRYIYLIVSSAPRVWMNHLVMVATGKNI